MDKIRISYLYTCAYNKLVKEISVSSELRACYLTRDVTTQVSHVLDKILRKVITENENIRK
jgi:hypothetical protein